MRCFSMLFLGERERERGGGGGGGGGGGEMAMEEGDIVIIGAGICGLAVALALQRKGVSSVVLEKADSLRAAGIAIGLHSNGWRALDQLRVGPTLREKALRVRALREVFLDIGATTEAVFGNEETRYMMRSDLVQALFDGLPPGTVRFGCHIVAVKTDAVTSQHILHFRDGNVVIAKVLIGCEGVNSIVAESLKLNPPRNLPTGAVRGLTNYPNGHGFGTDLVRIKKGSVLVGRVAISDKLVYWFVAQPRLLTDSGISGKPELIRQATLKAMEGFPSELTEMAKKCDSAFLTYTSSIRYKTPWDVFLANFHKGTMTVAGDAMHVMGPFLAQGGSAALEDAVVLARCLAKEMGAGENGDHEGSQLVTKVGTALKEYVKERRMRVTRLSLQTYLTGILVGTPSMFMSRFVRLLLRILFGGSHDHAKYDCGRL